MFPQAIAVFDPEYYTSKLTLKKRAQYHLYIQLTGIVCATIGFIAIYVNKNLTGHKHHFYTYHGLFGLIVMILLGVMAIGGVMAYYSIRLRTLIRPVLLKTIHSIGGILTLILGNVTVILGFYSNWYKKRGTMDILWVVYPLMIISIILVLRKSVPTFWDRILGIFGRNNL